MLGRVVLVGTRADGIDGRGKVDADAFFPVLRRSVEAAGGALAIYDDVEAFRRSARAHRGAVVVAIYNEDIPGNPAFDEVRRLERIVSGIRGTLVHPLSLGLTLGDKSATHAALGGIVPMPELSGSGRFLSHARQGTGHGIHIYEPGEPMDPGRHNARLIDTRHAFEGIDYFVCLRAMTVGAVVTDIFVRCRPAADGNASVHARDTPLNAALLGHFHRTIVEARRSEIEDMCSRAGAALSLGFYAFDLLPERDTGRLYICEGGIKFNDFSYSRRFAPIACELPFYADLLSGRSLERTAEIFVGLCRQRPRRSESRGWFAALRNLRRAPA